MDIRNVGSAARQPLLDSDPRTRLAQEKFFTLRPRPLERWLWQRRVPAAAERIFWFHWTQGARSGDWCSQFALHFVAQECEVDTSTVTRAYQTLKRLGLIRRSDPGRDNANPFAQATFVTEVLLPGDLLGRLAALPNRPRLQAAPAAVSPEKPVASAPAAPLPASPHQHLGFQERRERLKVLAAALSATERERWHQVLCGSGRRLEFDPVTRVPASLQTEIQQYLAARELPAAPAAPVSTAPAPKTPVRQLSVFEVARLRRAVQGVTGIPASDEACRQVLWAIESPIGSLRHFGSAHALNIALKKLREGLWTRPNRMPPNWVRQINAGASSETCSRA